MGVTVTLTISQHWTPKIAAPAPYAGQEGSERRHNRGVRGAATGTHSRKGGAFAELLSDLLSDLRCQFSMFHSKAIWSTERRGVR